LSVRDGLPGLGRSGGEEFFELVPSSAQIVEGVGTLEIGDGGEVRGDIGDHGVGSSSTQADGDIAQTGGDKFAWRVGGVVFEVERLTVDDVDAGRLAAACDCDVALLERGGVGGNVAGVAVGGSLDPVAGAGVAVLEVPGGQVIVR